MANRMNVDRDDKGHLCVDVCKRNGKKKLLWFANKSCPGNWLYSRLCELATKVTTELSGSTSSDDKKPVTQMYRVRKSWSDAKSQIGAYRP